MRGGGEGRRGAGVLSENESYRGKASETDRQTEIREFIKIRGDSEGVGGQLFCDCQRADKWLRGKM